MATTSLIRKDEALPSVFDDFFAPWSDWLDTGFFGRKFPSVPAANISETENEYTVSMAVPGYKKDDFNVELEGNVLTVSTEKEESKEEKEKHFTRKEYSSTSFSRSFYLPAAVDQAKIGATYTEGVLRLALPKKEEARKAVLSKKIEVK